MKTAVFYYSGKGSNRYLAEKAAEALGCDAIALKPRAAGLVLPATLTKISLGIKPVKQDVGSYERAVLCGPLYMGSLAAPCSDFIRKYAAKVRKLDFITCCGSTDSKKDDTFGYGRVFGKLRTRLGGTAGEFEAFPIELLLPEDKRGDDEAMMNTRMSDENFTDEVRRRLEDFAGRLKAV